MKHLSLLLLLLFITLPAHAAVQTKEIVYHVGDSEFTGYLAWDDSVKGKRPGVLVVHEWWGHNEYARRRVRMLAELGYTAFALDMYGTGKLADHPDTATAFMQEVTGNFDVMKARFMAGLDILKKQKTVDNERLAAIGYCMGGEIALEMARSGIDLDAVAVFHGGLATAHPASKGEVKAELLVMVGGADPFIPPAQVAAFEKEMKAAGAHYELYIYPGVKHSFTNPEADRFGNEFNLPLKYDADADRDSWQRMQKLFRKVFGKKA